MKSLEALPEITPGHNIPEKTCTIVRSGTSRFLVLREEEIPTGPPRAKLILGLLANEVPTDGLGGRHYQSNKVAVVGKLRGGAFRFHFYQVVPETGRLFTRMECSNAASASAISALLLGAGRPDRSGAFKSVNLATRQTVELVPRGAHYWDADWEVRFTNLRHLRLHMTKSARKFRFVHEGIPVRGEIVRHGNVFVMTNMPVTNASPGLVAKLAGLGQKFAKDCGYPESPSKVFIYDIRRTSGSEGECDAVCFSENQQHHSLPGSGAMALGAFLTTRGVLSLPEKGRTGETVFRLHHPQGTMTVQVHLTKAARNWEIDSTSFETPVRLLMHGRLVVP